MTVRAYQVAVEGDDVVDPGVRGVWRVDEVRVREIEIAEMENRKRESERRGDEVKSS